MKKQLRPIESQSEAILSTLGGVAKNHNKPYCWVSQETQMDLLSRYHFWNISRRTLNRRLRELEDENYFKRIQRHTKDKNGKLVLRSTLYILKAKFFAWAYRVGQWAKRFFNAFAVPKWAQYQVKPQQVSSSDNHVEGFSILLKEKDGSISRFFPKTGVFNST